MRPAAVAQGPRWLGYVGGARLRIHVGLRGDDGIQNPLLAGEGKVELQVSEVGISDPSSLLGHWFIFLGILFHDSKVTTNLQSEPAHHFLKPLAPKLGASIAS